MNVGGIAFYHGWDWIRNRESTLGKELEGYQEMQLGRRVLVPTRLWPNYVYSLTETPLSEHFGVLTTGGDPRELPMYQEDTDRRFVGDLREVGGTDHVVEFRSVREPLRNGQPLIRVRPFPNNQDIVVYPLVAIPVGKGCLILGGMALDGDRRHEQTDLALSQLLKILHAITNLIENQRRDFIPFDWRKAID